MRLYHSALTFPQVIKRVVSRLFRLRVKEISVYDVLENITQRGFILNEIGNSAFVISNANSSPVYFLRKGSSDVLVFDQVILQEEYKPLLTLISKYGKPENIQCVVDCGANIGLTSIYLGKALTNARFVAIEPSPQNFQALQENVSRNKSIQIAPLQKALWYENINVKISRDFRDGQDWSLSVQPDPSGQGSIEAITLQDIIAKENIEAIDVLKIDIEGAEKELLADESFLKLLTSVKFIAFELHEEVIDKIQVINQLQKIGFELTYKGETLFGVNKNLV